MARPGKTIIREAAGGDLERVADLWVELVDFHHGLDGRFWQRAPRGRESFREWMREAIASDDRIVLVAEAPEGIVGFVHGMLKDGPPPMVPRRGGFVTDLIVSPTHRRSGVGGRLAKSVDDWFRDRGASEVTLSTAVCNPGAVAFWKKMGFEPWTYTMWKPLRK